ncbi:IQ domain-containing protein IQM6-like [Hibiscus syriacus]|uniref:IQ domain-containing protein IQM6-like n=1 Tax=Hibiscus syriacus TaxID=106335 RepID=UPI001922BDA1|nr:IQ domain-containing protein IQM6-like [Hibiscus syriacus]
MESKLSSRIGSNHVQSMLGKSLSFNEVKVKTRLQSLSLKRPASDPKGMDPNGSGNMLLEESSSSENPTFVETESFMKSNNDKVDNTVENQGSNFAENGGRQHQAALRLQKVYKSFRTRRKLADCAVVAEQKWWELLDFAELKRTSVSFFEIEKQKTAVSRWSRARTRAAKVGKGLSKDEKARKLALQHWLEAIDPRHRYGHNLQFYYTTWLQCESQQPFFYWLDIGDGKEISLEKCPRSKLQQQCIKYLGPAERDSFEVVIRKGKLVYKQSWHVVDTTGGPRDAKWIFVLSASKTLYVGMKNKGTFQHSSFLAGGATLSAGRLIVEDGVLRAIWPHSGHYLPTEENFLEFLSFLQEHNVDLTNVKQFSSEDDEAFSSKNIMVQGNAPEQEGSKHIEETNNENSIQANAELDSDATQNVNISMSRWSRELISKIRALEIASSDDEVDICETGEPPEPAAEGGIEISEECLSEEPKTYQLAQLLSCKWSSGAGARISCMRDYPSELQNRVLEDALLSQTTNSAGASPRTPSFFSPVASTRSLRKGTSLSMICSLEHVPIATVGMGKSKSMCCFEILV